MRRDVQIWGLAVAVVVLAAVCLWLHCDCRRLENLLATAASLEIPAAEGEVLNYAQMAPEEQEAVRADLERQVAERKAECARLEAQCEEAQAEEHRKDECQTVSMADLAELAPDLYAVVAEEVAAWHALQRNTRPALEGIRCLEGLGCLEPETCRAMEDYLARCGAYVEAVLAGELSDEEAEECAESLRKQRRSWMKAFNQDTNKMLAAMLGMEGKEEDEISEVMVSAGEAAELFTNVVESKWNEEMAAVYAQLRELGEDFPEDEEPELDEIELGKLRAWAERLEKRREP